IPLGARLSHPAWRTALAGAGVPDDVAQDVVERIADSYVPWQENSFPGLLGNVVAGRISKQFDLGGTNSVIDAACGSSLSAVHMAAMELSCGRSDMVITGGVDTFNDIFMYTCFSKTPALSPSNIIRPFDSHSDGTLIGEGLGLVVLKRLEDAERDNDQIYAVIRGIGTASDGKKGAIYEPSADGQKRTLCDAYQQAGIDPKTISLVEAHGTGTKVGDATEIKALRDVYGESDGTPWCALGSVKSQIGHTKASAGSAGLIKTALALHSKVLPPTINVDQPQEVITTGNSPFYVNTKIRPWLSHPDHPRRAAVSAFGFGGSNFHCVLEEHKSESNRCDWSTAPQIIALSGTDKSSLQQQLQQIQTDISAAKFKRFAAQSRADFNSTDAQRILFVVESAKELNATVANAQKLLTSDKTLASTPTGIWYGNNTQSGKLAVLFPGQGAQYPQMLVDLACHAPQFLNTLNTAHNTLDIENGLNQLIYPHSVYSDNDQSAAMKKLQATQVAQPAIGAVSLGAWNYIKSYGITANAWGGHSYGELTALCAAGCYSSEDLFRLSQLRGELMAGDGSDKGTMLAVSSSLDKIEQLLTEEKLDLVLANRNTPSQGVLSGSRSEIERATQLCKERGLRCVALDVAAAFHSKLVAAASEPFLAALNDVEVKPADAPVYANKTAAPYPEESNSIRSLLADQIASPVEFVQQVEKMYASGITTFVEVGPGARLTGMVGKILKGKEAQAIALDSSNGKRSGLNDLARLLIQLSAMGYPIQLQNWDSEYALRELSQPEPPAPRMTVTLTGANYRKKTAAKPASKRNLVDANTLPKPVAQVAAAPVATPTASSDSLRALQDNMLVLQRMQEDTAKLHNQFLEGQAAAVQTMRSLMDHQMGVATPTSIARPTITSAATAPVVAMVQEKVIVQPIKAPVVAAVQVVSTDVSATLLEVVAEKTGYPQEMLELDMSLDADLGIDSIKRVEILSAIQEKLPELPALQPDQLGSLQTLRQIVEAMGSVAATDGPAPAMASTGADVSATLLEVVAEKTGYPQEMLELDMSLDADLGIDSIKRVEILSAIQEKLPELPALQPDQLGSLQTLRQIVEAMGSVAVAATAVTASAVANAGADISATLLEVVAEKTGYPQEMLELDMSLDADLGIDSIKRVEILSAIQEKLPELPALQPEQLGS
ncbi:MAG: acyltransferase domain-containing protein, partial [Deltaproteobacteria bacterium]|nr:acyltransferase domain-containing protein [Deltaproteobacteria bacterium]